MTNFTAKNDLELINLVKNQDSEAFNTLYERHIPLCNDTYSKFTQKLESSGVNVMELKEDNKLLFYNTILSYNPEKGSKFSTWLSNQVRYKCLNSINARKKSQFSLSLDDENNFEKIKNVEDKTYDDSTKNYIFFILESLKDSNVKKIYEMRYFSANKEDSKWKNIAAKLGLKLNEVIKLHERARAILEEKMKNGSVMDIV